MSETLEVSTLVLNNIKNENIEKNRIYRIYQKIDDTAMVGVWGENSLKLTDDKIIFNIKDIQPFSHYRGTLSLETKIDYYLKQLLRHFEEDNSISCDVRLEDEGDSIQYSVDIISTNTDVEKFVGKMLSFEFEFEHLIDKINTKVNKLLK